MVEDFCTKLDLRIFRMPKRLWKLTEFHLIEIVDFKDLATLQPLTRRIQARIFQEYFKNISKRFQGSCHLAASDTEDPGKNISRIFEEYFKNISRIFKISRILPPCSLSHGGSRRGSRRQLWLLCQSQSFLLSETWWLIGVAFINVLFT